MFGTLLGNYRVMKQLGEGGMGVVYVGRHETLNRHVAIKVLQPDMSSNADMVQRFFNEAQAATAIRHPGIVQVFDYGTAPDGRAFIVMELLDGETLTTRLKRHHLGTLVCCRIARQIANVLQAAHEAGITHRDLKPDNLFLVPDSEVLGGERVKVLDFGIAKLASDLHAVGVRTGTNVLMGTPSYMAPEQCRSAGSAEPRSDIYSLGCILFKMVCGRPPFTGGLGDIIAAHLHVPPPDPQSLAPATPAAFAQLILHLLAKQPSARPQTMSSVSRSLDELLRALGGPASSAPSLPLSDPTLQTELNATMPYDLVLPRKPEPAPAPAPAITLPRPPMMPSALPIPLNAVPRPIAAPQLPPTHAHLPVLVPATPVPAPSPALLSNATTLSSAAGASHMPSHSGNRRRALVLVGVAASAIATVTVIALANEAQAPPTPRIATAPVIDDASSPLAVGSAEVASIPDDAIAPPTLPTPSLSPTIASTTAAPSPGPTVSELEAMCRDHQSNRRWADLEQCAGKLMPLAPDRAAELNQRAVKETQSVPRITAVEAALRDKNLKRARIELDQVWPKSVDYPDLKHKYELAEAQAITDLARLLELVKDADCNEYNGLLVSERARKPALAIAEAARRTPCSPSLQPPPSSPPLPKPCIAEAFAEVAQTQYAKGDLPASLVSYEAAYACRPVPQWAEMALMISCNLRNLAKAKLHWRRLPAKLRPRLIPTCVRNQITENQLKT